MRFTKYEVEHLLSCIDYAYNENLEDTDKWEVERLKLQDRFTEELGKLIKRNKR